MVNTWHFRPLLPRVVLSLPLFLVADFGPLAGESFFSRAKRVKLCTWNFEQQHVGCFQALFLGVLPTCNLSIRQSVPFSKKEKREILWIYPKDHWTLKTSYFEDPTPACYTGSNPSIGGSKILRVYYIFNGTGIHRIEIWWKMLPQHWSNSCETSWRRRRDIERNLWEFLQWKEFGVVTLPKTNSKQFAAENRPKRPKRNLPIIHFQVLLLLVSGSVDFKT